MHRTKGVCINLSTHIQLRYNGKKTVALQVNKLQPLSFRSSSDVSSLSELKERLANVRNHRQT